MSDLAGEVWRQLYYTRMIVPGLPGNPKRAAVFTVFTTSQEGDDPFGVGHLRCYLLNSLEQAEMMVRGNPDYKIQGGFLENVQCMTSQLGELPAKDHDGLPAAEMLENSEMATSMAWTIYLQREEARSGWEAFLAKLPEAEDQSEGEDGPN